MPYVSGGPGRRRRRVLDDGRGRDDWNDGYLRVRLRWRDTRRRGCGHGGNEREMRVGLTCGLVVGGEDPEFTPKAEQQHTTTSPRLIAALGVSDASRKPARDARPRTARAIARRGAPSEAHEQQASHRSTKQRGAKEHVHRQGSVGLESGVTTGKNPVRP